VGSLLARDSNGEYFNVAIEVSADGKSKRLLRDESGRVQCISPQEELSLLVAPDEVVSSAERWEAKLANADDNN
jgi:hypothetical protein